MSTQKRKYELKARAARQGQTRQRIVEATVALHQEVGPARTTVAEIARRAGVQRLTVYNHFPDLDALLPACTAHWMAEHPQPDLTAAAAPADPAERLRAVLTALYGWYRETAPMQRRPQRARRHRMLDEREAAARLLAAHHEPHTDACEVACPSVLRTENACCRHLHRDQPFIEQGVY